MNKKLKTLASIMLLTVLFTSCDEILGTVTDEDGDWVIIRNNTNCHCFVEKKDASQLGPSIDGVTYKSKQAARNAMCTYYKPNDDCGAKICTSTYPASECKP